MKKIYAIVFCCIFCLLIANGLKAQTTQDTIDNPYWIEMMNDRSVNFYQTQRAFELYWQNRTIEKGSGWKVFKRWEWQAQQEIDAQGNFPDTDMEDAAKEKLIQYENLKYQTYTPGIGMGTATCMTKGNWKPVGPINLPINNTGQNNGMGRVNAIGLHPKDSNIIFAGAAAGGIWKTTNGGVTWNIFSDSLPTLGVSAIAIDPVNSDTMYFGSGDRDAGDALGYGVYKSTDGGKTWAQSTTGMGNREVGRLIIDPKNRAVLLAGCDNGIYRSTDYGANWTLTYSGGFMKDIIFNAYNTQQVYATRNGLFYRSINNGSTWTQITSGLPTAGVSRAVIDVNPNNASLVYLWMANGSVNQGFYVSRDSGVTFSTQSTSPNLHDYSTNGSGTAGQAWYNKDMVTDPTDEAVIYVAGVNIFKSIDTGKTWKIVAYWVNEVHADNHEMQRCPITKRIYTANDGGLYYTADTGATWVNISSGIAAAQIYKMGASRTDKDKLIVGFQDNGTGNYNGSWYTTYGGDGMDCEVDQTDSRYSYGELYYGDVFRVYNVNQQGKIAGNGTNGITESGAWVTPITLKEGSGNTMYIGYKNIWRSTNIRNTAASVTWTKISNSLGGSNSINFTALESSIADPDVLYASRSGSLYRSDDINAATPSYTTLTQPIAGTVSAIETDPTIAGSVYIGISNRVYRSLNKGATWTQVNVNLPSNVQCVLLDTSSPTKGIYVGTQRSGVWYTDTTMSAWRYFSNGLPATVNVTDLELYYENKPDCKCHILYGSTYNRGVWKSSIFNDASQKPVAYIEKFDSVVCSDAIVNFKDNSCNNPTEFKWAFTPNTVTFVNGTNDSTADASVRFNAKGNYTFKHIVENCNGLDTIEGSILIGDTVINACQTTTTNSFTNLGIFNVNFKTINRSSAGTSPEGAYVDLACTNVAKVKRGETFNISVTTGVSYNEQVKVFIDYNNDGDFVDAGELVWQPTAALTNHSGNITIPLTATTEAILRLRVRSDYNSIGTNPCSNLSYGQTEDYGLYIQSDSIVPKFVRSDSIICLSRKVVFTDSSYGGTSYPYSWNFGAGASPATASTPGPHIITYNTPGYKKVTLTIDGKIISKDSNVLVNDTPSVAFNINDSTQCFNSNNFALTNNTTIPSGSMGFDWKFGDGTNDTNRNISHTYTAINNFKIMLIGKSNMGCIDSMSKTVVVYPNAVPNFSINNNPQCFNTHSFNFTNSSSLVNGTYVNEWNLGDGTVLGSTNVLGKIYNAFVDSFAVRLKTTTDLGCVDSMIIFSKLNKNPISNFEINDTGQCLSNNSFVFTDKTSQINGSASFTWSFGDGTFSTNQNANHVYAIAGTNKVKQVVITDKGCKDSALIDVFINPNPVSNFTINDSTQCFKGNDFAFTETGAITKGTYTSNWTFGDAQSGVGNSINHQYSAPTNTNITLTLTSDSGCIATNAIGVEIYANPNVGFMVNDSAQCLDGNNFKFTDTTKNLAAGFTRAWYADAVQLIPTVSNTQSTFTNTGIHRIKLQVVSADGCMDSLTKLLTVEAHPDFDITGSDKLCLNQTLNLTANSLDPNLVYSWKENKKNAVICNPYKVNGDIIGARNIVLSAINDAGCETDSTLNARVVVYPLPKPVIDTAIIHLTEGVEVLFKDMTPTTVVARNWDFLPPGSGSDSIESIVLFDTATIIARLTVTDKNGCVNSIAAPYFIVIPNNIYLPTAFTPNGDGRNEEFKIPGFAKFKQYSMRIFNRWGELVFESSDPNRGWDGKYKGTLAMAGNYGYLIEVIDFSGKKIVKEGTVLIMR